jgi:hypothetical protein
MKILPPEAIADLRAIAESLIETLEVQAASRGVTDANVLIDAAICCLLYTMSQCDPALGDEELIRRVKTFSSAMNLSGAPGPRLS